MDWPDQERPASSRSRARRSANILRNPLRTRLIATFITHARSDSICSPRSLRSHARASASCTASSAAVRLPHARATPATNLG